MKSARPGLERRQAIRKPLHERLLIMWEDDQGHELVSEARSLNVSADGMSFHLPYRIAIRTPVLLNCPTAGIVARATVRYCIWAKAGYQIGIEGVCATTKPSQN